MGRNTEKRNQYFIVNSTSDNELTPLIQISRNNS